MIIFNSSTGDPMLLDSVQGLHALFRDYMAFLASSSEAASFPAITTGDPAPYDELLQGFRVRKTVGDSSLELSSDRWLELSGSKLELEKFAKTLLAKRDGEHSHWYSTHVSLIIEADNWRARGES